MLLAQAQEISNAAARELSRAAEFGFAGYIAVLILLLFSAGIGIHFWFIVKPDQKQRRESAKTQDECLATFAANYAVQTQLFSQIDARLSTISKEIPTLRCPYPPQRPSTVSQSVPPNLTPTPFGA